MRIAWCLLLGRRRRRLFAVARAARSVAAIPAIAEAVATVTAIPEAIAAIAEATTAALVAVDLADRIRAIDEQLSRARKLR